MKPGRARPDFWQPPRSAPWARREFLDGQDGCTREKVDGFRMLAVKDGSRVRLLSRRGYDMGERFPGIVAGLAALPASSVVLDGEVAVFDEGFVSHLGYLMGRVEPEGVVTQRIPGPPCNNG